MSRLPAPFSPDLVASPTLTLRGLSTDAGLGTQQVCERAGVTRGVLRLYEREGLIPPPRRTPAGYRQYPPDILSRLQAVRLLKDVGCTLKQIALLLGEHDRGRISDERLRQLAADELRAVEARLARLQLVRDALAAVAGGDRSLIDDPDCHFLLDFLGA